MLYDRLIARFVHHSYRKIAITVACAAGITVNVDQRIRSISDLVLCSITFGVSY